MYMQTYMDYHSASPLKQHSASRHVATLEHIIPILSQTLILIAPACLAKTQFLAWLNRDTNHDLPHSRRAR